jgi:hypothetical protein
VKSSLRSEPDVPGDLLRAIFGNVTEPELAIYARARNAIAFAPSRIIRCGKSAQGSEPSRSRTRDGCFASAAFPIHGWRSRFLARFAPIRPCRN